MFLILQDTYVVKQTKKKGRGVFATKNILNGTIIGDYLGNTVPYEEIKHEEVDFMMFFTDTHGIIPDRKKDDIYLLNHSCNPNCFMYPYKGHMLFVAIRNIKPKEELTISYLYPPQDCCEDCDHKCLCNDKNCLKTMHTPKDLYEKWQKFKQKEESQTKKIVVTNGKLQPLEKYPEALFIDLDLINKT